jgi:hypothetical protein
MKTRIFLTILSGLGILVSTAMPLRATGVQFSNGRNARNIPIENWNNLVVMKGVVNGQKTGTFILDSGAGVSVIDSAFAAESGIDLSATGISERTGMAYRKAAISSFEMPGIVIRDLNIRAMNLQQLTLLTGHPIDGILGYELLKEMVVEIGYCHKSISFFDPATYRYRGKGEKLNVTYANNWPVVEMSFNQSNGKVRKGKVLIDTGSMMPVSLNEPGFCNQTMPAPLSAGIMGTAPGGVLGRIDEVQIGDITLKNVYAGLPSEINPEEVNPIAKAVMEAGIGLVGGPLLCRFNLIFDYSRNQVIFEPNCYLDYEFRPELLGAAILATGKNYHEFQVFIVAPGTPAAEAGLQPGDLIKGIDHYNSGQLTLWTMRQLFKEDGKMHVVTVNREGKDIRVPVSLKCEI